MVWKKIKKKNKWTEFNVGIGVARLVGNELSKVNTKLTVHSHKHIPRPRT